MPAIGITIDLQQPSERGRSRAPPEGLLQGYQPSGNFIVQSSKGKATLGGGGRAETAVLEMEWHTA